MNDRELLELAAIAYYGNDVGIERYDEHNNYLVVYATTSGTRFAPLTDDDHALRLAVKLCLQVHIDTRATYIDNVEWDDDCNGYPHNNDPYAATRRAIVRAAAEIGKEQL